MLNTEFKDFTFSAAPPFDNLAGNSFNSAPELTGSLAFSWSSPSGFFASGDVAYTSTQYSEVENLDANESDSFTLVNARAGYRWERFQVAVFANNMFDEEAITRSAEARVDPNSGAIVPLVGSASFFTVVDPRLYGLELRAEF